MFTGIVEDVGIVKNITASGKSGKIRICANKVLEDVHLGDSIAVNGVCLTVCEVFQNEFVADVMMETVRATNLSTLTRNSKVNLELKPFSHLRDTLTLFVPTIATTIYTALDKTMARNCVRCLSGQSTGQDL